MRQNRRSTAPIAAGTLFVGLTLFLSATSTFAQEPDTDPQVVPKEKISKSGKAEGVDGMLSLSSSVNLASNHDVVGQPDGVSLLFGLGITGGLDYVKDSHEWRNTLRINESWARTPALEELVKNTDSFEIESLYQYFMLEWTGFYGRLGLDSQLFETSHITANPQTYSISEVDGETRTVSDVSRLELASPFEPFALKESGGWFAEPIRKEVITLSTRLGLGFRENFARGVLVVRDDEETQDVVEVTELDNVLQGGLEAFVGADGRVSEADLTYRLGLTGFLPVINNDEQDRSAIDLFRYGLSAGITFNAFEWLSADYNLKILKDPQLLDTTQVHNNFLITFKYSLIERQKGSREEPDVTLEEQLDEARDEADDAEDRVEELERKIEEREEAEDEAQQEAQQESEEQSDQ